MSKDPLPARADDALTGEWYNTLKRVEKALLSGIDEMDHARRNSFYTSYLNMSSRLQKIKRKMDIKSDFICTCVENQAGRTSVGNVRFGINGSSKADHRVSITIDMKTNMMTSKIMRFCLASRPGKRLSDADQRRLLVAEPLVIATATLVLAASELGCARLEHQPVNLMRGSPG